MMTNRIRRDPIRNGGGDCHPRARGFIGVAAAIAILCLLGVTASCEIGPRSGIGLRLPTGDAARGELAFSDLGCDQCHVFMGDQPRVSREKDELVVALGGKVDHISTHGELVTSIVNPSHGFPRRYLKEEVFDGERSKMARYNETMTVAQLIDLTEYLQSKYELDPELLYGP